MEYGSSKKCYSQIFLLFLPVIIDYSPKQNIKNNSMDKDLKKVVVLLAHPNMENSQANKALLDAIKDIEDVAIFNLYEMLEQDILNMDAWSRIISHANAVVYQFPFYWISLYWWLPLPVLNLMRIEVEEEIASRWMNFCVLIRVVLCMQGWCGRLLSWCMVWEHPMRKRILPWQRIFIKNG